MRLRGLPRVDDDGAAALGVRQRVDVDLALAELVGVFGGEVGLEGRPDLEEGGAEWAALVDDLLVRPELPLPLPRPRVLGGYSVWS